MARKVRVEIIGLVQVLLNCTPGDGSDQSQQLLQNRLKPSSMSWS